MVFVDSNVILDVITADPLWQAWSEEQLSRWFDVMGSAESVGSSSAVSSSKDCGR